MTTRQPLTVLIHTLNEVDQIEACLRSVDWADEIYLLDSFSTDGTVELVREKFPEVRIEIRRSLGSAAQKNYGMDHAKHDWILVVDADERVTPELRDEIRDLLGTKPDHWGFRVYRKNFVTGREIRWGLLRWDHVNRLFHRKHARYPNRRVHADLIVDGPTKDLDNCMIHHYVRSFRHMAKKMNRYGHWSAAQLFVEGKSANFFHIAFHPFWRFVREYLLLAGFLDGSAGLGVAVMHTYYVFQKYLNLWEFKRLSAQGLEIPLPEMDESPETWRKPWETARAGTTRAPASPVSDQA